MSFLSSLIVRKGAPDGEPYAHIIVMLQTGQNIAMEVSDEEATDAIEELHLSVQEKRASYIVLHPLDETARGAEYHYPGLVIGLQRITKSHKDHLDAMQAEAEDKQAAQEALMRGRGLGGPVGRR